jgi:hypothetical protein
MKKKLILITLCASLVAFGLGAIGGDSVSAANKTSDEIPVRTYVIGSHMITSDTALTTPRIMLAATTLPSSSTLDDMVIYYKKSDGTWVDSARGTSTSSPAATFPAGGVEIEYVDFEDVVDIAKREAKADLQARYDALNDQTVFSAEKLMQLSGIKTSGDTNIDAATTEDEVRNALSLAREGLISVIPSPIQDTTAGTAYDDLRTAFSGASTDATIKLVDDINITTKGAANVMNNKTLSLDLNNHHITDDLSIGEKTRHYSIYVYEGTLNIFDSSTEKNGGITTTATGKTPYVFLNANNSTLNIHSGTFTATNGYIISIYDAATTNISEGTFNGWIANLGTDTAGSKLNIEGGVFNNNLYLPAANAEINITGGTFDVSFSGGNNAVIELRAGFLNISGGTFKYTEDFDPEKPYINSLDTKLNTNGAGNYIGTIVVSKPTSANITSGYASPAIVIITGGTFINNEGKDAIVMANHSSKQVDDGTGEFRDNHDIIVNLDGVSMQIDGEINKYDKADSRESKFYDNRPQQP